MRTVLKKNIINRVLSMLLLPLYLISKIIPKNRKLIVLGSSVGLHFSDNTKYLFLYLEQSSVDIEYVWITKNKKLYESMNGSGRNFMYAYSVKGMWLLLRSKVAVISHRFDDLLPILMGGTTVIQLFHGTPLKKIAFDDIGWRSLSDRSRMFRKVILKYLPYLNYFKCDYVIASSEELIKVFSHAFQIDESKVFALGQPRNDCFSASYKDMEPDILSRLNNKIEGYDKVISWLPTHRAGLGESISQLLVNYRFDAETMDNFLKRNNYVFIIKPHFIELNDAYNIVKDCTNIRVYDDADPYPLLRYTDLLITDYSSVFFDFLITNKPIIFTPFDYYYYIENVNGFYFDYNEVTPGPKCSNWDEIIVQIEVSLQDDKFQTQRKIICEQFNKFEDHNAAARIVEFIKTALIN